jgi:hypothetical protein
MKRGIVAIKKIGIKEDQIKYFSDKGVYLEIVPSEEKKKTGK